MSKIKKASFVFLLIYASTFILNSQRAHAYSRSSSGGGGFMINPSLMYLYDTQSGTNGSGINTSRTLVDARLGYLWSSSPFYLGGIYSYDAKANTGNSSSKDTFTSYGASLGLITDNVYMLFSYFMSSQYDQVNSTGTSTTTYSSGSGFEVALGYMFSMGSSFKLGPEIAYRSLSYTQVKNPSGTTGTASLTATTLVPYLSMMFSL